VDAVVVGSGPNGLAAAITLARAGRSVLVREAQPVFGGGLRTMELTLPGFHHDLCSTVHPLAAGSPFLRALPLAARGAELVHSAACLAHPLDDGSAVLLRRSPDETAAGLGEDADPYLRLFAPLAARWDELAGEILIINDSYNANPSSMKAGIEVLANVDARRWLVMGDMGELGDNAEAMHETIGEFAKRAGVRALFALGDMSAAAARSFGAEPGPWASW
jgi:phytoene dehydrogenase-like protein